MLAWYSCPCVPELTEKYNKLTVKKMLFFVCPCVYVTDRQTDRLFSGDLDLLDQTQRRGCQACQGKEMKFPRGGWGGVRGRGDSLGADYPPAHPTGPCVCRAADFVILRWGCTEGEAAGLCVRYTRMCAGEKKDQEKL